MFAAPTMEQIDLEIEERFRQLAITAEIDFIALCVQHRLATLEDLEVCAAASWPHGLRTLYSRIAQRNGGTPPQFCEPATPDYDN